MARRQHLTLTVLVVVAFLFSISYLYSGRGSVSAGDAARLINSVRESAQSPLSKIKPGGKLDWAGAPSDFLEGESMAPKLENATLKAELGRATWRFLHTMVAKYPEKPTPEDRKTLELFFLTFGKLYPCGDCAKHFRGLLKEIPPQTGSRNSAVGWTCEVHNRVNKRLKKKIYDCSKINDEYDCGCGDDKDKDKGKDKEKEKEKDRTDLKARG